MPVRIVALGPGDDAVMLAAADLFDQPPTAEATRRFLASPGHHLLLAFDDQPGGPALGFISGVETTHPDKGTELFLYELGVGPERRREGIATALVAALRDVARALGCSGMWVATEPDNEAAIATYRRAGSSSPEPSVVLGWTFD